MRRSPLPRARTSVRPRRATPRQRAAPRWTADEWEAMDRLLQARARGRCECGCGKALNGRAERHHRQRRRDGGDRLANLLLLLPSCHAWWTAHPGEAMARGLIVSAYVPDPAGVPVVDLSGGERWLGDGGEVYRHPPGES